MNNLLINNPAKGPGATIYFCKVIRFYASSGTADVVTIDNNISLLGCSIACSMPAGFAYGTRYIPTHDDQNSEVEYVNSAGDIYCVAAFLENDYNNAAILGFIFPLQTTLCIAEYGLYIFRHESDVMWMIRGNGTMQIYHPSGSIIKIGDDNSNEMTSERDQGGLYSTKTAKMYVRPADEYNAKKQSNLFIKWHKGQEITLNNDGDFIVKTQGATLTITASGAVEVNSTNNVDITTSSDVNINASGKAVLTAPELDLVVVALKINGVPGATGGGTNLSTVNGIVTAVS